MEIQIKAADPIAPSENGCRKEEMLMRAWNMRSSGALMLGDVNQSSFFFLEQYKCSSKSKEFHKQNFQRFYKKHKIL